MNYWFVQPSLFCRFKQSEIGRRHIMCVHLKTQGTANTQFDAILEHMRKHLNDMRHLCLWLKCRVSVNCRQWFVSISMECLDREECENKILKIDLCGHLPLIKPQPKANFAVGELALSKRLPLNQIFFGQRFGSAYRSIWTTATGFIPKYVNRNPFVESFATRAINLPSIFIQFYCD